MKTFSSLAILDFDNIPAGVYAVDSILKKAPIAFIRAGTVTRGRYLVIFGGSTAATQESLDIALSISGDSVIDHTFLHDIHHALAEAVFGKRRGAVGSLLVVETATASSIVRSVEAALKGTPVELIEIRLSDAGLAGKGVAFLAGSLPDVEAAAALAAAGTGDPIHGFRYRLIAAPHETLERAVAGSTQFDQAQLLELDGEAG
ncbi:MAG: BMC domain-containing protein [Thermoanaerobaculia bacterium]